MKFIDIVIVSIGLAVLLVDVLSIGQRFKKLFKINPLKRVKPFDCLKCMSFWSSIGMCLIYSLSLKEAFVAILGTLLTVIILEKKQIL